MKPLTHEAEQGIAVYPSDPEHANGVAILELSGQNVTRHKTTIRQAILQHLIAANFENEASVNDQLKEIVNRANDVIKQSRQPSDQNYGSIIVAAYRPATDSISIAAYGDCHAWLVNKDEGQITQIDSGRRIAYLGSANINEPFLFVVKVQKFSSAGYLVLATDTLVRSEIEQLTQMHGNAHRFLRDLKRNHAPGAVAVLASPATILADQRRDRIARARKVLANGARSGVALAILAIVVSVLWNLVRQIDVPSLLPATPPSTAISVQSADAVAPPVTTELAPSPTTTATDDASATASALAEANQRASQTAAAATLTAQASILAISTPGPLFIPTPQPTATLTPQPAPGPPATEEATVVPEGPKAEDNTTQATCFDVVSPVVVTLLSPPDGDTSADRRTFAWDVNCELGNNQAFEPIFWKPNEQPLFAGRGLVSTTSEKSVEIGYPDASLVQVGNVDLLWSVRIVQVNPYDNSVYRDREIRLDSRQVTFWPTPEPTPTNPCSGNVCGNQ